MLLHGITYGGHPVAAAMALRNIEIFEREGVLENVRAHEGYLGDRLRELQDRLPIVGDVRGAGYFWALELVRDEDGTRFSADERERLLRGFLDRPAARGGPDRPPRRPRRRRAAPRPAADLRRARARRDGREDRGGARRRLGALLRRGVKHDAHGWWLAEAGPVAPAAPLRGDHRRRRRRRRRRLRGPVDRVAAARARRERRACCEAGVCGHGPSGRNGGFAETLWTQPARPASSASAPSGRWPPRAPRRRASRAIGAWCEARGRRRLVPPQRVPARLGRRGAGRRARRIARGGRARSASTERGRRARRATRCARAAPRRASAAACSRPTTRRCTRRGSRSGCASA